MLFGHFLRFSNIFLVAKNQIHIGIAFNGFSYLKSTRKELSKKISPSTKKCKMAKYQFSRSGNVSKWVFLRGYLYWKVVSEFSRAEIGFQDVLMGVVGGVLV